MAIHFEKTTTGAEDFELGLKRESPVRYTLTLPDSAEPRGLVFVIPGFGEDSNSEYARKLREFIADQYALASTSVMYHAIQSRPANGGQLGFEDHDIELLTKKLQQYGSPIANNIAENVNLLDQAITRAKAENRCNIEMLFLNQYELLTSSIYPGQGEYQNFGVMQALDHLYVLGDLLQNVAFDRGNIIAFGSSHGGYIANLMAKFAPNSFSAVLDNSSYACAPLPYVVGRQLGCHEFLATMSLNIAIACFVVSPWRLHPHEKNFFSDDRQKIRSFLFDDDIKTMAAAGGNKTQYRFLHSEQDMIAKVEDKLKMATLLQDNGFDVRISLMGPKDVDGHFVKNLNHGMDLSLKTMFTKLYETIQPRQPQTDFDLNSEITYKGIDMDYTFTFREKTLTAETT